MRIERRLLRRAYRLLRISRPADPCDCAKFDRVMLAIERWLGKEPRKRKVEKRAQRPAQ